MLAWIPIWVLTIPFMKEGVSCGRPDFFFLYFFPIIWYIWLEMKPENF